MKPPPLLERLCTLFDDARQRLGRFEPVATDAMPEPARHLLAHDHHMTVALEQYHGCRVNLRVLEKVAGEDWYGRKIVLARSTDGRVVQFGIVRVELALLGGPVRAAIEQEAEPLGRILIAHRVFRKVQRVGLYRLQPAPALGQAMARNPAQPTYSRTARIHVGGRPAIELLEIL